MDTGQLIEDFRQYIPLLIKHFEDNYIYSFIDKLIKSRIINRSTIVQLEFFEDNFLSLRTNLKAELLFCHLYKDFLILNGLRHDSLVNARIKRIISLTKDVVPYIPGVINTYISPVEIAMHHPCNIYLYTFAWYGLDLIEYFKIFREKFARFKYNMMQIELLNYLEMQQLENVASILGLLSAKNQQANPVIEGVIDLLERSFWRLDDPPKQRRLFIKIYRGIPASGVKQKMRDCLLRNQAFDF